jgi:hypothetical protein
MDRTELSRRWFLKEGGMGVAGAAIGSRVANGEPFRAPAGTMPARVLGKTGVRVGALALGGVGAPVDFPSDERKSIERALEGLSLTRAYPHPVYIEA